MLKVYTMVCSKSIFQSYPDYPVNYDVTIDLYVLSPQLSIS